MCLMILLLLLKSVTGNVFNDIIVISDVHHDLKLLLFQNAITACLSIYPSFYFETV